MGRLAPVQAWKDSRTALAFVGRVAFPTGGEPFGGGGVEAGVQALAAFGLGERFDLYLGLGATFGGEREHAGFEYARARGFGHLALEWRFARTGRAPTVSWPPTRGTGSARCALPRRPPTRR